MRKQKDLKRFFPAPKISNLIDPTDQGCQGKERGGCKRTKALLLAKLSCVIAGKGRGKAELWGPSPSKNWSDYDKRVRLTSSGSSR